MHSWARYLIGLLQIGGGVAGIVVVSWSAVSGELKFGNYVASILPVALFILGIAAGLKLLRKSRRSIALTYWFQGAQLINFSTPFISHYLCAGAWLGPVWESKLGFKTVFGVGFYFRLLNVPSGQGPFDSGFSQLLWDNSTFGVNLIPLAVLLYVGFCVKRSRRLAPFSGFQFSFERETEVDNSDRGEEPS
jgi:hypothetical protein